MHVGQAAIDPVVANGEPLVIDSQQVQHGGVNVVNLGGMIAVERFVAPFVGGAVTHARLHPSAAKPVGEYVRVVIATFATLGRWHPTEFGGPQDNSIFQHSTLFEVLNQCRAAASHAFGQGAVIALYVFVRVPIASRESIVVAAPDLHEADASFQQATCDQAFLRKVDRFFVGVDLFGKRRGDVVEPVEFHDVLGLLADVDRLGSGQLHAGGEFVAANSRIEPAIARAVGRMFLIELLDQRHRVGTAGGGDVVAMFVGEQVGNRVLAFGVNDGALVL